MRARVLHIAVPAPRHPSCFLHAETNFNFRGLQNNQFVAMGISTDNRMGDDLVFSFTTSSNNVSDMVDVSFRC